MTFKHQYKVMLAVMVLLAHAFIANAQDDEKQNTGESLGKQYLNNRVPGLKYGPEKPKAQRRATIAEQQENHSESSGMQLKKGTISGMRVAPGGGGATSRSAARSAVRTQGSSTLPSDQKAEDKPAVAPATNTSVPTQGDVKEPQGLVPVNKTIKATKSAVTKDPGKVNPEGRKD